MMSNLSRLHALSVIKEAESKGRQVLNVSGFGLASVPDTVFSLHYRLHLTELDLSSNALSALPDAISLLSALRELNVNRNQLRSLPDSLGALRHLRTLNAATNQISSLPACLVDLPAIQVLNFSGNRIEHVDLALVRLPTLSRLFLLNNPIANVPRRTVVAGIDAIKTFFGVDVPTPPRSLKRASPRNVPRDRVPAAPDLAGEEAEEESGETDEDEGCVEMALADGTCVLERDSVRLIVFPGQRGASVGVGIRQEMWRLWGAEDGCLVTPVVNVVSSSDARLLLEVPVHVRPLRAVLLDCVRADAGGSRPAWSSLPRAAWEVDVERSCVRVTVDACGLFAVRLKPRGSAEMRCEPGASEPLVLAVPEACEVRVPPGAVSEPVDVSMECLYADEGFQDDERPLASLVVKLEPHRQRFQEPVELSLPLVDWRRISEAGLGLDPALHLLLQHSDTREGQPPKWEDLGPSQMRVVDQEEETWVRFEVQRFCFFRLLWTCLASTFHEARIGASYVYPHVSFSMHVVALMQFDPEDRHFGLVIIVYRSDSPFPELGNYSVHVGGTVRACRIRSGSVRVRVVGTKFKADEDKKEGVDLCKVEADFRGRDFDKSFACEFLEFPPPKGVFGKVVVERLSQNGDYESACEFNMMRLESGGRKTVVQNLLDGDTSLDGADQWPFLQLQMEAAQLGLAYGSGWAKLADFLGFTRRERRRLRAAGDPLLALLTLYQRRGGSPADVLSQMQLIRGGEAADADPPSPVAVDDLDGPAIAARGIDFLLDPLDRKRAFSSPESPPTKRRRTAIAVDEVTPRLVLLLCSRHAGLVVSRWRWLASHLRVPDLELSRLESQFPRNPEECAYRAVSWWRETVGASQRSVSVLAGALRVCGLNQEAARLEKWAREERTAPRSVDEEWTSRLLEMEKDRRPQAAREMGERREEGALSDRQQRGAVRREDPEALKDLLPEESRKMPLGPRLHDAPSEEKPEETRKRGRRQGAENQSSAAAGVTSADGMKSSVKRRKLPVCPAAGSSPPRRRARSRGGIGVVCGKPSGLR